LASHPSAIRDRSHPGLAEIFDDSRWASRAC
jgi:hypothetical protein